MRINSEGITKKIGTNLPEFEETWINSSEYEETRMV